MFFPCTDPSPMILLAPNTPELRCPSPAFALLLFHVIVAVSILEQSELGTLPWKFRYFGGFYT